MRMIVTVCLLAALAAAKPPESKGFVRMDQLREKIASRHKRLADAEEYARKPREEKILISFERGQRRFDKKVLDGKFVAETVLGWSEVNRDEPTEAGKRVLQRLPLAFEKRYGRVVDVPKKERYDASMVLWKALDSKYLPVRTSAILALKKIYRTENAFMYEPEMDERERRDPIKTWKSFIRKQK